MIFCHEPQSNMHNIQILLANEKSKSTKHMSLHKIQNTVHIAHCGITVKIYTHVMLNGDWTFLYITCR